MQYTYCAPDREATARYVERYSARFSEDGFAPWTAVFKREHRVVGWGGLNRDPMAPTWGVEISYFIHPVYWGRGLATELVQAALELAFSGLELTEVGAFTHPKNRASSRILGKAGFSLMRYVPELDRDQYSLAAAAWRACASRRLRAAASG